MMREGRAGSTHHDRSAGISSTQVLWNGLIPIVGARSLVEFILYRPLCTLEVASIPFIAIPHIQDDGSLWNVCSGEA